MKLINHPSAGIVVLLVLKLLACLGLALALIPLAMRVEAINQQMMSLFGQLPRQELVHLLERIVMFSKEAVTLGIGKSKFATTSHLTHRRIEAESFDESGHQLIRVNEAIPSRHIERKNNQEEFYFRMPKMSLFMLSGKTFACLGALAFFLSDYFYLQENLESSLNLLTGYSMLVNRTSLVIALRAYSFDRVVSGDNIAFDYRTLIELNEQALEFLLLKQKNNFTRTFSRWQNNNLCELAGLTTCQPVYMRGLRAVIFSYADNSAALTSMDELQDQFQMVRLAQQDIIATLLQYSEQSEAEKQVVLAVKETLFLLWLVGWGAVLLVPYLQELNKEMSRTKGMLSLIPAELIQQNSHFLAKQDALFKAIQ